MHVWSLLHMARSTGRLKSPKNRHLGTIGQLCPAISSQLMNVSTIGKKSCWTAISPPHVPQYGERPTNGWDLLASLGHPNKFQPVFEPWLRYCTDVAQRRSTKLCRMFGRLLVWYIIGLHIHFWGLLPPIGILPGTKFTLRPSLVFSYIGSVTARHSSSGR